MNELLPEDNYDDWDDEEDDESLFGLVIVACVGFGIGLGMGMFLARMWAGG